MLKSRKYMKNKKYLKKTKKGGVKSVLKKNSTVSNRYTPYHKKEKRLTFYTPDISETASDMKYRKHSFTKTRKNGKTRDKYSIETSEEIARARARILGSDLYKDLDEEQTEKMDLFLKKVKFKYNEEFDYEKRPNIRNNLFKYVLGPKNSENIKKANKFIKIFYNL